MPSSVASIRRVATLIMRKETTPRCTLESSPSPSHSPIKLELRTQTNCPANSVQKRSTIVRLVLEDVEYFRVFSSSYLNPGSSKQYLYCLKSKCSQGPKLDHGVTFVGKLDMMWRALMGELGRLQTSQLQRMVTGYGDLRLLVKAIPSVVKLFTPFDVICTLQNCCDRNLDLTLTLDNSLQPGLIWDSISGVKLEELTANKIIEISLSVIPTMLGLQVCFPYGCDTFLSVFGIIHRAYSRQSVLFAHELVSHQSKGRRPEGTSPSSR
ncbi:unnamed protein product [Soboliphyme baturini]|uniref:Mediator of RNA polymerase II transcription subunit 1 n=1 Tax=Soboliphyme baturini TaxID=241478 RepID=A0A183IQ01_9BILA|nr:unnamed protein product [Soboliphyme baturini]